MILYDLCCSFGSEIWKQAAHKQKIELRTYTSAMMDTPRKKQEILKDIQRASQNGKVVLLFSSHGMDKELEDFFKILPTNICVLPIGADAILLNRGSVDAKHVTRINEYQSYSGEENVFRMMAYIRKYLFEDPTAPIPLEPIKMPFDGIYSLVNNQVYYDISSFLEAQDKKFDIYVGMLSHRSSWLNQNLQVESSLIEALNQINIGVIPVFSSGEKSEIVQSYDFEEIVEHYFSINGQLFIQGLINFQMHLIKAQNGLSIAENSVRLFQKIDIPVFHPISSYFTDLAKWKENVNPLAMELQSAYLNPEMAGMIEPVLVGGRDQKTQEMIAQKENIAFFARRVKKWAALRTKSNHEKKLALVLHNSVCSGVEATVGKAFGLDAFESAVSLMHRLNQEGYQIENIPESGEALKNIILQKKAFSDFRWTSVEDILESGGCLYKMPVHNEYLNYFHQLTPEMQKQMLDSWGTPPGEGMVKGDDLIITGVQFGNLTIMVQPKRGCYGAKCTGEVCRILHNPHCPPTHQYLATYRYIEDVLKADAIIHLGTEGSLEYLPGKGNGLGQECWPYAVVGSLPNLYPYHAGVLSEGTIAKRRSNAVLLSYYPASSSGFDEKSLRLMDKLNEYCESYQLQNAQEETLREQIIHHLSTSPSLQKLVNSADSFYDGVQLVRSSLLRCAEGRKITKLHTFGKNPEHEEAVNYLCELLYGDGIFQQSEEESEYEYQRRIHDFIENILQDEEKNDPLSLDIRETYYKLQCVCKEEDSMIAALNGKFIPSSEGGMPDENGRKILPTGRNFFMMNMDKIPSPAAYERGVILANQLIESYQTDEGKYPKKIAMNMISLDIARTHGEQLSQFLYLLGVRPIWDQKGRVLRLEAISIEELGRPRIDVTLRISGVMRDTWPDAVTLMDEAVLLVSSLNETEEENFILANIHKMELECGELGERARTIRIFGDPPGAFGAGIDLALKASAWENEKDLARYFIQSSAFAYGKELDGRKSIKEFVQNTKNIDLSCDVSSSRRMDTLACGFGLQVHGAFKIVAETIGGKKIRQYQSMSERNTVITTTTLEKQIEKDIQQTLLNASWQDSTMEDAYTGASEMMHRIQNVFDVKCTSDCVQDQILDQLVETYINDEKMRKWLLENNSYAAEEIARRFLELETRGKWRPDNELLKKLQDNYLSIEGCMEGVSGENGEIQGGSVEIIRDDQVESWKKNLEEIDNYLENYEK